MKACTAPFIGKFRKGAFYLYLFNNFFLQKRLTIKTVSDTLIHEDISTLSC